MGNQTPDIVTKVTVNGGQFICDYEIHVGYQNANGLVEVKNDGYFEANPLTIVYGAWYDDEVISGIVKQLHAGDLVPVLLPL